jgi:hypothetical protein
VQRKGNIYGKLLSVPAAQYMALYYEMWTKTIQEQYLPSTYSMEERWIYILSLQQFASIHVCGVG